MSDTLTPKERERILEYWTPDSSSPGFKGRIPAVYDEVRGVILRLLSDLDRVEQERDNCYHKDRGKTNEINILTKENRDLSAAIARLTAQLDTARDDHQRIRGDYDRDIGKLTAQLALEQTASTRTIKQLLEARDRLAHNLAVTENEVRTANSRANAYREERDALRAERDGALRRGDRLLLALDAQKIEMEELRAELLYYQEPL